MRTVPPAAIRPLLVLLLLGAAVAPLGAQSRVSPAETLFVYGPGGPYPAMREAADSFGRQHDITVQVTAGPTAQWLDEARLRADVIFSGSEHMMTDFVQQLGDSAAGAIDESTILPLYLRPAAILVRKGNPDGIRRFEDLLQTGRKVLVVQGAGQTGMWEDVAGRTGDIATVRAFRKNIGAFARNSAEAKQLWAADTTFDAWLIWNIWQVANAELADLVPLDPRWRIYRDCAVALTQRGRERARAREFVAFLRSPEGGRIFGRWGWVGLGT
jgi:accessory colonization factor AcfC